MKKYIAFFLIAAVMLLGSAVVVLADTPVLSSLDSFDTLNTGTVSAADVTTYAKAFGSWFYPEGSSLEIIEDGYSGKALKITENDATKFQIALLNDTAVFAPTADAPVYVSFKLKVDGNTGDFLINSGYDSLCYIMTSGSDYIFMPTNKSGNLTCTPGEWYDIQVKFSPNRADIRITDKYGTSVTGYRANNANYLYMYSCRGNGWASVAGQQIIFDEIRISQGEEISTEPVNTPETENVSRMPELSFRYEPFMKVSEDSVVVTVTDEKGNTVDSDKYQVTTSYETVNVIFEDMLDKDTEYTVTLSGVEDMDGLEVPAYEFTFTTEIASRLTLAENGLNISSGDTPAIELTFDGTNGYPTTDVKILSVIYSDGEMSYLDFRNGVIDADGKLILSSYTLPDGKELSDLTILVFADSPKLIPVCEAINCFE